MARYNDPEAVAVSTDRFTWDHKHRCFVAEASTLGNPPGAQIYPDSADVGIALRSQRTGKCAWFSLSEEIRDFGGEDIVAWQFVPIPEAVAEQPKLRGVEVHILND
jgi:hypothetical protein